MAIIKQLKETNSDEKIYPITHVNAVLDNDGNSVGDLISSKQNALVSGSNIKTVNGNSLLGSGNVRVAGFQAYSDYDAMQDDHTQQDGTIGFDGDEEQFYIYNSQNDDWLPLTDEVVVDVSWWFEIDDDDYTSNDYNRMLDIIDSGRLLMYGNKPVVVSQTENAIALGVFNGSSINWRSVASWLQAGAASITFATTDQLRTKQDCLTFDPTPTSGSTNPVTSGGVYTALQSKYATLTNGVATIDGETANYTAIYTFFSNTENAYLVHGNKKYHLVSESGFANPLIFVCVEENIIYCLSMHISGQWTEKSYNCTAFKEYVSESAMFSDDSQPNGTIAFEEEFESFYIWNSFSYEWKPLADFTPNVISSVTATESTASGGNNTVTITQSNGTTTTFNVKNGKDGKDGADGVSLGEVAIADDLETDDSEKVLSAKQGVALKKKTDAITDNDKNGLTERVKKKLTSLGWEYGKYLSRGTLKANAAYCVTPLIQIDNTRRNHSLTFSYQFNSSNTQEINLFTSDATYKGFYSCSANNLRTFNATADAWDSTYYLRLTLNPNKIRDCYVKDNTTGEYLWKGSDVLDEICLDYLVSYGYVNDNIGLLNEAVNNLQDEVGLIGKRSFGITSVFDGYSKAGGSWARSVRQYNLSSQPWVDVVCYNLFVGSNLRGHFFGFCPVITSSPQTSSDYIGFLANTWNINFIIRRGGSTIHNEVIFTATNALIIGFRLDFRQKNIIIMKRTSAGALESKSIDLSEYDLDLGMTYLYNGIGYCSYPANIYIAWNSYINMSDFSAFFKEPLNMGKFKKFTEHTYPTPVDNYDGGLIAAISQIMNSWSSVKNDNGHWVASIDSQDSFLSCSQT